MATRDADASAAVESKTVVDGDKPNERVANAEAAEPRSNAEAAEPRSNAEAAELGTNGTRRI